MSRQDIPTVWHNHPHYWTRLCLIGSLWLLSVISNILGALNFWMSMQSRNVRICLWQIQDPVIFITFCYSGILKASLLKPDHRLIWTWLISSLKLRSGCTGCGCHQLAVTRVCEDATILKPHWHHGQGFAHQPVNCAHAFHTWVQLDTAITDWQGVAFRSCHL